MSDPAYYSTKRVTAVPEVRDGVPGMALTYGDGYRSWCPDTVFGRDYQPTTAMSFGHALAAMKAGTRVTRPEWNCLTVEIKGSSFLYNPNGGPGGFFLGEKDMLADDWMIVEDAPAS